MIGAFYFYTGLIVTLAGATLLIKPLAFLGVHTRPEAGFILAVGFLLSIAALRFNERHSARIQTPCRRVYPAVRFSGFQIGRSCNPRLVAPMSP
jgi:hypothetical protein